MKKRNPRIPFNAKRYGILNKVIKQGAKGNRQKPILSESDKINFRWANLDRLHGMPHPDELMAEGYVVHAFHPRWHRSVLMRKVNV
jgi:hypothetical protein